MLGDEVLCQSYPGGEVSFFYSLDECLRLGAKICGMEEL